MIYSRSRWSDLLAVCNVYLDESSTYLEAMAFAHKDIKSSDKKTRLLPIVAPEVGVVGKCWAEEFLELRGLAGLTCPGDKSEFMLPAPSQAGSDDWTSRYLTSQEANMFIKAFLPDSARQLGGRRLTTHSTKATALSWAAKCEISGGDGGHCTLLAGHCFSCPEKVPKSHCPDSRRGTSPRCKSFWHGDSKTSSYTPTAGLVTPVARVAPVGSGLPTTPGEGGVGMATRWKVFSWLTIPRCCAL